MVTNQSISQAEAKEVVPGNNDAGKTETPPELDTATKPDQHLAPRPAPLTWFLVCFGLYLGALLYGKSLPSLSLIHPAKRR
jgi:hypothetical protein